MVTPPIPGVPENTTIPYASAGAFRADGSLTIRGGSLSNTGTISSAGAIDIGVNGSVANNKRGFLQGDSSILVSAGAGFSNDGIVYGSSNAPSSITIASSGGGFANSATGIVIAGGLLDINTASFSNAADNVSAGVGSLGNARLRTTGAWDAGANPLKVNGLLTANTNGIFVDVGKTWEQQNVAWAGTLTNLGTTNLGNGNGMVVNQSSGAIIRTDTPNTDPLLVGSYQYTPTPPVGYSTAVLSGYTDVLHRAKFTALTFSGGLINVAGDVSLSTTSLGYSKLDIAQTAIWFGVPDSTPTAVPAQIFVNNDALSIARTNFTGNSIVTLVGPSAGTVTGANVTINAGDLTVDRSHTAGAFASIGSAQGIAAGTVVGSAAALAALQSPSLLGAAALSNSALQSSPQSGAPVTLPAGMAQPSPQSGALSGTLVGTYVPSAQSSALSSSGISTLVGASSPLGSPGTFAPGGGSGGGSGSTGGSGGTAGGGLALPAPNLATVQGAWAALMSRQLAPVVTDWAALNAQANAINTSNLTLNLSGKLAAGTGTAPLPSGWTLNQSSGNENVDTGSQTKAPMLGENGTQVFSSTVWKGVGKERIDIENPNPGQRPGQIHYQDTNNVKWIYDPTTDSFPGAPKSVNKLLENPSFRAGIDKGLRFLGEAP